MQEGKGPESEARAREGGRASSQGARHGQDGDKERRDSHADADRTSRHAVSADTGAVSPTCPAAGQDRSRPRDRDDGSASGR